MIDTMPELRTHPLFSLRVAVDGLQRPGGPAGLERRVGTIPDGEFEGERLRGRVLAGGRNAAMAWSSSTRVSFSGPTMMR
jgi:hypothetical protein